MFLQSALAAGRWTLKLCVIIFMFLHMSYVSILKMALVVFFNSFLRSSKAGVAVSEDRKLEKVTPKFGPPQRIVLRVVGITKKYGRTFANAYNPRILVFNIFRYTGGKVKCSGSAHFLSLGYSMLTACTNICTQRNQDGSGKGSICVRCFCDRYGPTLEISAYWSVASWNPTLFFGSFPSGSQKKAQVEIPNRISNLDIKKSKQIHSNNSKNWNELNTIAGIQPFFVCTQILARTRCEEPCARQAIRTLRPTLFGWPWPLGSGHPDGRGSCFNQSIASQIGPTAKWNWTSFINYFKDHYFTNLLVIFGYWTELINENYPGGSETNHFQDKQQKRVLSVQWNHRKNDV